MKIITIGERSELSEHAFDNAPLGISLVRTDGKFLKVNNCLCTMLGYSESELLKKSFHDITDPNDQEISDYFCNKLISGELSSVHFEKRYFTKGHSIIWVRLHSSLKKDFSRKPLYFITHIENITNQKKAEVQVF